MSLKLYEIADGYRAACEALEETGGELTPESEAEFDRLSAELPEKVDAVCALIAEAENEAYAAEQEEGRLYHRRKAALNRAASLRAYVRRCLVAADRPKVKGSRFTATVRTAGKPSIAWTYPGDDPVPREFVRVKEEVSGTAAHEAWRAGTLPDGFTVKFSEWLDVR